MIHSLTAMWAIDKANKRAARSRRCPKCGLKQVVAKEDINEALLCQNSGTEIQAKDVSKGKGKTNPAK